MTVKYFKFLAEGQTDKVETTVCHTNEDDAKEVAVAQFSKHCTEPVLRVSLLKVQTEEEYEKEDLAQYDAFDEAEGERETERMNEEQFEGRL